MSENGWIDQELYYRRFFVPNIPPHFPVVLLCDGRGSHCTPDAITKSADQGIIVFCIPTNTTRTTYD